MLKFLRFWYVIFVMYWSLPFISLFYRIKWLDFLNKRRDMFEWSSFMMAVTGTTVARVGPRGLDKSRRQMMYLCNHRCWGDFFVDMFLTEGDAQFLSRRAVYATFPVFITSALAIRGILLFKRTAVKDKEAFNRWIDAGLAGAPSEKLLVYPEGTRSRKDDSLPLKRGMLMWAYTRQVPVQAVITAGKEKVLGDEKHMAAEFGHRLRCGYSETLDPKDFPTADEFVSRVNEMWLAEWKRVYSAEDKDCQEESKDASATFLHYSFAMRVQQAAICTASIALFAAMMWGVYSVARIVVHVVWRPMPPLGLPHLAVLAIGIAVSVLIRAVSWQAAAPPLAKYA